MLRQQWNAWALGAALVLVWLARTSDASTPPSSKLSSSKVSAEIGAWEASLANTLAQGDRVLVAATGRFGLSWAELARRRGLDVEVIDFGNRNVVDNKALENVLGRDARSFGDTTHGTIVHYEWPCIRRTKLP